MIALRGLAALLGGANLLAQLLFPAYQRGESLVVTTLLTLGLLCFAFFPRSHLIRWWLLVAALGLVAFAVLVREATVAVSFQVDVSVWVGFAVVASLLLIMVFEALTHRARTRLEA